MNETNDTDKPVAAPPPKATLHLKRPVEQGTVRQSFSHGRSKAVVVEKVKRRVSGPGESSPTSTRPAAPTPGVVPAQGAGAAAWPISIAPDKLATVAPAKPAPPPPPKTGAPRRPRSGGGRPPSPGGGG
jgi:translation initiation factor IF-2